MHRLALVGLLPAICVAPSVAQIAPIVTETEFLSVLDTSHPAVGESTEKLGVARARRLGAKALENPTLSFAREAPSGGVQQTDWTVSWHLPEPARGPRIEAAERAVAAAEARHSQQLRTLRLSMREIYARWALAAARQDHVAAHVERVEALARRESARAERGEASGLAAHRLRLTAAALRSRAALSTARSNAARAEVAAWHSTLPATAQPTLPPLPPPPALGAPHPLVAAAEAELAEVELEQKAAQLFIGSPEITFGWQRQEAGLESLSGAVLGVAWSMPLTDRNRSKRAASDARVSGARARLERVRRQVVTARAAADLSYAALTTAVADAETALAESARALDGAEAAFRHGEGDLTDLLETHRSVGEAELARLDLYEQALAAHRELERLAGPGLQPLTTQPQLSLSSEQIP